MVMPKQTAEKCPWGLHCPICKNKEEYGEEGWDGDLQNQPRMCPQNYQYPQPQGNQHPKPQPQSSQCPQSMNSQHSFDVPDSYAEQIELRKEWGERIECLNEK